MQVSDVPTSPRVAAFFGPDHPALRYDPSPCPRGIPPEWFRAPWREDPVPTEYDPVAVASIEYDHDRWRATPPGRRWSGRTTVRLRRIEYAQGGNVMRYRGPRLNCQLKPPRGDRQEIAGFSSRSRLGCLRFLNSIDRAQVDSSRLWFATLTYPGVWSSDPKRWKADLEAWRKRVQRHFGIRLALIWKLEPQRRGAPHFHLILLMPPDFADGLEVVSRQPRGKRIVTRWKGGRLAEFREFVSSAWSSVVAGWDGTRPWVPTIHQARHEQAGTNVEPLQAWEQAISYCGKYIGKAADFINEETGELRSVGRYWGVWRREEWPIRRVRCTIDEPGWLMIRRAIRKYRERKEKRKLRGPASFAWSGRTIAPCSAFVPSAIIARLIAWSCPWLAEGVSTREMVECDVEAERMREVERDAWLYC